MRLFLLFTALLLPISALAQTPPPIQPNNVLVIPNALGASVWSQDLSSVDIVGTQPGHQMYFSHDRYGRNSGYGYINQPYETRPLEAPAISHPQNSLKCCSLPELPR